jgi:hypothetical protein
VATKEQVAIEKLETMLEVDKASYLMVPRADLEVLLHELKDARSRTPLPSSIRDHPVEALECTACGAKAGEPCSAPFSGKTRAPHRARWLASGLIGPGDKVPEEVRR